MPRLGFGRLWRVFELPNPAVATDWELKAPGSTLWRVISIAARLVADANVANRQVTLIADNQTKTWYTSNTSGPVTAGQTVDFCGHTSASVQGGSLVFTFPLPTEGLLLQPGNRLRATTALLQAGDQWSLIAALVDEIPSDQDYIGAGPTSIDQDQ